MLLLWKRQGHEWATCRLYFFSHSANEKAVPPGCKMSCAGQLPWPWTRSCVLSSMDYSSRHCCPPTQSLSWRLACHGCAQPPWHANLQLRGGMPVTTIIYRQVRFMHHSRNSELPSSSPADWHLKSTETRQSRSSNCSMLQAVGCGCSLKGGHT